MPSKPSLTLEQKAKIISALPSSSNKILTAVPARIYFAHPQRRDKWSYGGLQGALAFTYEKSKDAFVLKLVDFAGTGGVIWQHELDAQFEYHKDQPLLHSFAGDDCMIGVVFDEEKDATLFYKKVTTRKAEKATKISPELKVKKGGKIDKSMISVPQQGSSKHVALVGYDEEKGFTSNNVDDSWLSLVRNLQSQGITAEIIEENKEFIQNFIRKAQTKDVAPTAPKKKPPPPPVPRRGIHVASNIVASTNGDLSPPLPQPPPRHAEHDEAITRYISALSPSPSNPIDIFVERSSARASKGLWEDALKDANEVIKLDPSSHRGYEKKYMALHGAADYGEASNALIHMLSIIENSPDEEIRRLRENYTTPGEIIAAIDIAIHEIFNLCPLVLIDVATGQLCDAQERVRMFKSETPFKKFVFETAITKIDRARIRQSVAIYFKWIMFSHTWEGKEPTFKDVNLVDSVWKLDKSPLNEKLRQFCGTAREDGYRWAWSDTCCIDKDTSAVLSQSLTSMYTWYEEAAETLVYLADVLSSSERGALTKSRWMTRAWTLQELLASRIIRFYDREWKLYLNDMHANHKESPAIKQELAHAMGVSQETITSFRPEDLGVREKLRLASTRNATVEEDIAYSLIGIFSSDIAPRYGLGKSALGQLLENIVARSGDVTVLAWTGKSLPYNSALPNSLAVYSQIPYSPSPMEDNELDTCVEQLRTRLAPQDVIPFYFQLTLLPRATFSNRCLQLPCIVFSVTRIGVQELDGSQGNLYRATVSLLGRVEFRTADAMPLKKPRKLVFVHPWLRDLRDPLDGFVSDDEQDAESNVGLSDDAQTESDAGAGTDDASAPASPLHAEPSARVETSVQALRLIARLGYPFNALLLEQQSNGQYKRVATEHEIIVLGVPSQTNPKAIRAKVLEIV